MERIDPRRCVVVIVALLALVIPGGCGRPPQIGDDDGAFKAVDALYTAVSARDVSLVGRCEASLRDLHAAGKLPEAASSALAAIAAEARQGDWEDARDRLHRFMRGQRR
jgi:hypothetical protein